MHLGADGDAQDGSPDRDEQGPVTPADRARRLRTMLGGGA